jgi:hypothetical protein
VRGASLIHFGRYFGGTGSPRLWTALAEACRTGKPLGFGRR